MKERGHGNQFLSGKTSVFPITNTQSVNKFMLATGKTLFSLKFRSSHFKVAKRPVDVCLATTEAKHRPCGWLRGAERPVDVRPAPTEAKQRQRPQGLLRL